MDKLQAHRPPPGVRERRRFGKRLDVTHPIEVAGRSGGFSGQTVNISRTGVLLWVADDRFIPLAESDNMVLFTERVAEEFGEGLEIRLSQDIALEAEVVRVTRRAEKDTGPVLIACRYARPLTREEWERLGFEKLPPDDIEQEMAEVLGQGTGADRRRAMRVEREQPVEIHSDYAAYRAQVVNLSAVGVLLQMTDPAFAAPNTADRLLVCTRRLGTQFGRGMRVRFLESDVTIAGEIVRVGERKAADGADILVGCKFDPPLDPATCERLGLEPLRPTRDSRPQPEPAGETRVRELMKRAKEQHASDLHLKAGSPPRARIGGVLSNLGKTTLEPAETHAMALDLLDRARIERLERRGHAEAIVEAGGARFRVNAIRQQGATALAIRSLPSPLPSLPPDQKLLASIESGLVLVSGHGGSGRSTTLAAIVDELNRSRPCHILSLEDPVEFPHREVAAHITQRDLATDGLTVREALRQSRHLDVDVVAVARLVTTADAEAAVESAEAGRLVLAVVDAGGPDEAVERFLQGGRPGLRERAAAALRAVSCQRLVHADDGTTKVDSTVRRLSGADVQAIRDGKPSRNGTPRP